MVATKGGCQRVKPSRWPLTHVSPGLSLVAAAMCKGGLLRADVGLLTGLGNQSRQAETPAFG